MGQERVFDSLYRCQITRAKWEEGEGVFSENTPRGMILEHVTIGSLAHNCIFV